MNRSKKFLLTAVIASAVVAAPAFAVTDTNKTIKSVGIQTTGLPYATFTTALSVNCQFGLLYLGDVNSAAGKAMIAVLLSAQAGDKHINRIDYTVGTAGDCNATLIEAGQ